MRPWVGRTESPGHPNTLYLLWQLVSAVVWQQLRVLQTQSVSRDVYSLPCTMQLAAPGGMLSLWFT